VVPNEVKDGACDVVAGQRVCDECSTVTWKKLAGAGHTKLVFETDDLLSEVDPSIRQAAHFYDAETVERYHRNMAVADVITVTTDLLAEHVRTVYPTAEIYVLPSQVPGWLLDHEKPTAPDPGPVTIGWRGSNLAHRDFGELAKPVRRFLQHPNYRDRAELHCMGAPYQEPVRSNLGRTRR